ncbi:MAG: GntR family transcriptional regulator [Acidobacteriia bacterium]|nr:GntR family transcriptional regulator [Terriglobia bacterium]
MQGYGRDDGVIERASNHDGGLSSGLKEGETAKISGATSSSQTARATLALREMLVKGRFRPGERIREVPLAQQLNVSRIPLRLALERLAHEGFLEVRPTRGFVVQQFSTEDIFDAIELRGLLEGSAARLAAERLRNPQELASMREASLEILNLVRRPKLTSEAFRKYIDLNERFHTALVDLSRSRMLRRGIEHVCSLPFASPGAFLERQFASSDLHELFLISADQHVAIVDAIANREGLRAEMLTREHARVARRNLEDALKNRETLLHFAGVKLVSV